MPPSPRLSLCIPTFNRARYLKGALESGLREAASLPPGIVEILVCDNASSDETPDLISRIQMAHPELRAFRNDENLGFDRNYLRCVEEARGEFVWVMGDDDIWLPGSVARVLHELDAGADACLCLGEACDMDLNPVRMLRWYSDPIPPTVWDLATSEDLVRYFDRCISNAGAFAFISVSIFRRVRLLQSRDSLQRDLDTGYTHVWSMMKFLRQPTRLHYIPEALVRDRLNDESISNMGLYNRWMIDLRGWAQIADAVFGDDARVHDSFSKIVGRNHNGISFLPWFRLSTLSKTDWLDALPFLVRAGFSPARIAAVDFGIRQMCGKGFPARILNHGTRPFVDLPFLVEKEKNIAILALGGVQNVIDGAALLGALRSKEGTRRIRVCCTSGCIDLLDGFDVQCLDPRRYAEDEIYRESVVQTILDFAPELLVNLDPGRGIEADDLTAAAHPAGAIAYELPDLSQDPGLVKAANGGYTCLVSREAGPWALLEALGLEAISAILWPTSASREEAQTILAKLGWVPARTLVVLVDHPSILEDSAFHSALAKAAEGHWTFVGMGGKGVSYQSVETLLGPWDSRSVNLTGVLGLGSTAALLQLCGGFLGGTPLLQSLAKACGCAAPLRASRDRPETPHEL